jgi:hypothetical protein
MNDHVVHEILSDSELIVREPGENEFTEESEHKYKIIPKLDQSQMFNKCHEILGNGECIGIFPEVIKLLRSL